MFAVNNEELLAGIKKNWNDYSEDYFQEQYVKSYKRRLEAVIKAKGFPTKF